MGIIPLQIMVRPAALLFVALQTHSWKRALYRVFYSAAILPEAWAHETPKNGIKQFTE
jgi:hypothetical protein